MLDLLAPIGKCNDKLVIVAIRLAPDFVEQPRVVTLEKPDHCCFLSARRAVLCRCGQRPNATMGSILDARYAGKYAATAATSIRMTPPTANDHGSAACTL